MYDAQVRVCALRAYEKLASLRRVHEILGISKSTIQRWHTATPCGRRERAARKVSSVVRETIKRLIKFACTLVDEHEVRICGCLLADDDDVSHKEYIAYLSNHCETCFVRGNDRRGQRFSCRNCD